MTIRKPTEADVLRLRLDVDYINSERLVPEGKDPIQLRLDFGGGGQ